MRRSLELGRTPLFDVLAHVAYALAPLTRAERAEQAKVGIHAHFDIKQQVFLDFVLSHYVSAGVDVRIIMSEYETVGYLEQLQRMGLNVVDNVKIQPNVHNKGIIVDGKAVLVSSQNWSTDGTLYNRDSGVIIHDTTSAQYFQQIFLHDWDHLAGKRAASD